MSQLRSFAIFAALSAALTSLPATSAAQTMQTRRKASGSRILDIFYLRIAVLFVTRAAKR